MVSMPSGLGRLKRRRYRGVVSNPVGRHDSAGKKVTQPITSGILKGQEIDFHLIDKAGNETLPLYPISEMRKTRMVVDYEENKVMFKDNPNVWHELPTTG